MIQPILRRIRVAPKVATILEGEAILAMLLAHMDRPEFGFRHVWQEGDLLMWDNCCSTHARTWFDPAHRRMMRRITIKGEPVL